jgi:hypothetical protein
MKLITVGDLHGSPIWKTINPGEWDRVIFIGDYVDSADFSEDEIIFNLQEIIDLKNRMPEKIILLWGNHDLAYFYGGHDRHRCSGFRNKLLPTLFSLFTSSRQLFQAAWGTGNHLWTHAGVVQRWYNNCIKDQFLSSDRDLADTLNRLFNTYYEPLYYAGLLRGGLYEDGGIFWAHKKETEDDPLRGYHQIVGHTKTQSGILVSDHYGGYTSVTYVDCLDSSTEFLKLEVPGE